MNYLTYFCFDNIPFPTDYTFNYFFPKRNYIKIIDELSNLCRFYNGIYTIIGENGIGKTSLLTQFIDKVKNNDFIIYIKTSENTDILKTIANTFKVDNKNIDNIFNSLSKIHETGKNIIIIIDDAHNLSKEQFISLSSLVSVIKYLKIILSGTNLLNTKLKNKHLIEIRKKIIKKYKLKPLSFFGTRKYILYMLNSALALSQYRKIITLPALYLIAFTTNNNIYNINYIMTNALVNTAKNKKKKITFINIYHIIKNNFSLVKENIYLKFQKIFAFIIIALSLYFGSKIIIDRYNLIINLKAKESVILQEKELKDNF